MDAIEFFRELPSQVRYKRTLFELQLINNYGEARLVYALVDKEDWINPITKSITSFLWLGEGIYTQDDFIEAIKEALKFLNEYSIIEV